MKAKRVRFKDSVTEPNRPASCRYDDCSAPCEAREDLPMPPSTANEPKTSEFAFFKKLKQDVGHTSCRNPPNRKSVPMRKFGPSNHAREFDNFKLQDVKSSQFVKKSTTDEIASILTARDVTLESSAMPTKEPVNGRFKCSPIITPPTSIHLDSSISATANASVNPDSQQKDGDTFLVKKLKLRKQIAKTLFPEADEIPKESNLVLLLLSRLLPESCQETLSRNLQLRQAKIIKNQQFHLDSNIQLEEITDNSRKLVKADDEDYFLDTCASATQSHRFWKSGETVEGNDASASKCSVRMLLGQEEENEQGSSVEGIASVSFSNKFGDRNLLTWGNELYNHPASSNSSRIAIKNDAYKQFSDDEYDNSRSCKFRDLSSSYEVLNRSCDSLVATKSNDLVYKDNIHNFNLDRRAQLRLQPSALSNLRDYAEPNSLNEFEIRREPFPLFLGWDTDQLDMHDSAHSSHMELEIYRPPLSTCYEDLRNNSELEIYCPPSSTQYGYRDGLENSTLLDLPPYSYQDHDIKGHHLQQIDLVPRSPCVSFMLSYDPEQLNSDDSGLFKNISECSNFSFIPQKGFCFSENIMCERNSSAAEAFLISDDFESESGFK